jgi:hypothetical protein
MGTLACPVKRVAFRSLLFSSGARPRHGLLLLLWNASLHPA